MVRFLNNTKVIGRKARESCGKSASRETQQAVRPRGKRVHQVEIITHTRFRRSEIRSMLLFAFQDGVGLATEITPKLEKIYFSNVPLTTAWPSLTIICPIAITLFISKVR